MAPIVGYQGALIREMPELSSTRPGRLLIHTPLKASVAREVVDLGASSRASTRT